MTLRSLEQVPPTAVLEIVPIAVAVVAVRAEGAAGGVVEAGAREAAGAVASVAVPAGATRALQEIDRIREGRGDDRGLFNFSTVAEEMGGHRVCYLIVIVWQITYSKWDIDPHFILGIE